MVQVDERVQKIEANYPELKKVSQLSRRIEQLEAQLKLTGSTKAGQMNTI